MTNKKPAPERRTGPRHALPFGRRTAKQRMLLGSKLVISLVAVAVMIAAGTGWAGQRDLLGGIITSAVLEGEPDSPGSEQNILIMGLDSRLDQHGTAAAAGALRGAARRRTRRLVATTPTC